MKPSLVVVGLGNPGKEYGKTRHNVGRWATDSLGEAFGTDDWQSKQKFLGEMREARIFTIPILLLKPDTYMNRSGESVRKVCDFFQLDPTKQILVLSDDIDLAPGVLRLRTSGGPGTHNGLKSLVEQFGEDFPRLRIGIGDQGEEDLSHYVLSPPTKEEKKMIDEALQGIPDMVQTFVMESS